jgi:hypothetical protein
VQRADLLMYEDKRATYANQPAAGAGDAAGR